MKVAIVGASGAVGQEFLKVLDERNFPIDELLLFGSSRSAGREYTFRGKQITVKSLKQVVLWDEVKDKLKDSAFALSGGQQQRLCIARALAISPSILLMVEPTSALDPISTSKIEDLIHELKKEYTIVIVTHNMQHYNCNLPPHFSIALASF